MTESPGNVSHESVNFQRGPEWVTMAVLGKPRGIKGEMFALPYTSHWERFREGKTFRVWFNERQRASREVTLDDAWSHNGKLILKFAEANSIDEAEELRGGELCIQESEREPLPEGEFYYDDLKGMAVVDARTREVLGEVIGFTEGVGPGVVDVRSTGAQCLNGKGTEEWQIPFAKEICTDIDLERRELRVQLPAGLRDLNRP